MFAGQWKLLISHWDIIRWLKCHCDGNDAPASIKMGTPTMLSLNVLQLRKIQVILKDYFYAGVLKIFCTLFTRRVKKKDVCVWVEVLVCGGWEGPFTWERFQVKPVKFWSVYMRTTCSVPENKLFENDFGMFSKHSPFPCKRWQNYFLKMGEYRHICTMGVIPTVYPHHQLGAWQQKLEPFWCLAFPCEWSCCCIWRVPFTVQNLWSRVLKCITQRWYTEVSGRQLSALSNAERQHAWLWLSPL